MIFRIILAIVVAVVTIALGIYVDISWAIIGGIEQTIRGFQASPVSAHDIAFGLLRCPILSGLFTWLGLVVGIGGAVAILHDA